MHVTRTNLHFDGFAIWADDGGVQTLVQVEFRHRDVVLEAPDYRLPVSVNHTKCPVTIAHVINHDANGHQVEDVIKLAPFLHHLFVDAPQVFAARRELGFDFYADQHFVNLAKHTCQVHIALGRPSGDKMFDFCITLGKQRCK